MNTLDKQYLELLQEILDRGVVKKDRTGTGTQSIFGHTIRHDMRMGFPVLTTKKLYWKGVTTELIWFLRGDTNIKYLVDRDCHIWNGDSYKNYCKYTSANSSEWNKWMRVNEDGSLSMHTADQFLEKIKTDDEFARKWGELGPIYGKQWRKWTNYTGDEINEGTYEMTNEPIDQIQNLINDLKTNPDSRRLMVSAWNVDELDQMVLPPCHYGFQCWTRELSMEERIDLTAKHPKFEPFDFGVGEVSDDHIHHVCDLYNTPRRALSLSWNQRSVDTLLGLPFNIASYGLLLSILAKEVNMVAEELIGNLGDTHLYLNHRDQAREQIKREPHELPELEIDLFDQDNHYMEDGREGVWDYEPYQFKLKNYKSHPAIKADLSN